MPTPTGAETIAERLSRRRADLARIRETIARHETNGAAASFGGQAVTEIAYQQALARESRIAAEIATLEARLAGSAARPGLAQLHTRFG